MTEEQWLSCDDPLPLLAEVRGQVSERKHRLFVAACCRQLWGASAGEEVALALDCVEHLAEPEPVMTKSVTLLTTGEAVLDCGASDPIEAFEVRGAGQLAQRVRWSALPGPLPSVLEHMTCHGENAHAWLRWDWLPGCLDRAGLSAARQADLFREVVRSTFRALDFRRSVWCGWEGGVIGAMAQEVYEERVGRAGELDPWRLGVLADALEDAGCAEDEFLDHLRSPGPHVRGCWAIDLILSHYS